MSKFFYIRKYEKFVIIWALFSWVLLNDIHSQISIIKPTPSDTIFYNELIEIKWTGNDNKPVNIDFSVDYGSRWQNIATNVYGTEYLWKVPDLLKSSILIRISSSIITKPYVIWEIKKAHSNEVRSAYISDDSKFILSASRDGTVKLWDIASQKLVDSQMISPSRNVWDAKLYGSIDTIIIAADNRIVVWDRKNQFVKDLVTEKFNDYVRCLAVNYEKRLIAIGTSTSDKKNFVYRWDTKLLEFVNPDNWESYSLDISLDGEYLINATYGGMIIFTNINTGINEFIISGHGISGAELAIWSVKLSPDRTRAISCGVDKTVRVWNVETQEELKRFASHSGHVRTVDISKDGKLALSGSLDDTLRQYFLPTLAEIDVAVSHNGDILSASYSYTADSIVTTGRDSSIKLWKNFRMIESVSEVNCKARYREYIYIPHLFAYAGENIQIPIIFSGTVENASLLQYSFNATAKIEVPNRLINVIIPNDYKKTSNRKDTILLKMNDIGFRFDTLGKFIGEAIIGDRKIEEIRILSFEIEDDSLFAIETGDGSISILEYCVGNTQRTLKFAKHSFGFTLKSEIIDDRLTLNISTIEDGNYIIELFNISGAKVQNLNINQNNQ